MTKIVLASASPRRKALLDAAGCAPVVRAADIDETPRTGEKPRQLVERLASEKAAAVGVDADVVVVAADTTVALGDTILNKPVNDDDARRMLRALSGVTHAVFTGWCVRRGGRVTSGVVETAVRFRALSDDDIGAYLQTGEHIDKAGAYGIQGAAAVLVSSVHGSLTNVIGLPIDEVLAAIACVSEAQA